MQHGETEVTSSGLGEIGIGVRVLTLDAFGTVAGLRLCVLGNACPFLSSPGGWTGGRVHVQEVTLHNPRGHSTPCSH